MKQQWVDLNDKKFIIAPYSRTSDSLRKKMLKEFSDSQFFGFCDKVQTGSNILKLNDLSSLTIDYVLIYPLIILNLFIRNLSKLLLVPN